MKKPSAVATSPSEATASLARNKKPTAPKISTPDLRTKSYVKGCRFCPEERPHHHLWSGRGQETVLEWNEDSWLLGKPVGAA